MIILFQKTPFFERIQFFSVLLMKSHLSILTKENTLFYAISRKFKSLFVI